MADNERRQFFRTGCDVLLDVKPVDKETAEKTSAEEIFSDGNDFTLLGEFQQLDQHCLQLSANLGKLDKNLLDYLSLTQRKINQLSQIVMARLPDLNALPRQRVEISENGVSFCGDRFFYLDSILALRLVFLPDYQSVVLFGKVVRCEQGAARAATTPMAGRDLYHIAAHFLPLTESSRRVIAQQVLKAQRQAKLKQPGSGSHSAQSSREKH